jgi:hypothetical protein
MRIKKEIFGPLIERLLVLCSRRLQREASALIDSAPKDRIITELSS